MLNRVFERKLGFFGKVAFAGVYESSSMVAAACGLAEKFIESKLPPSGTS